MNRTEFWLGVSILAVLFLATFSGHVAPGIITRPLLPQLESLARPKIHAVAPLIAPRGKVPVKEETIRG